MTNIYGVILEKPKFGGYNVRKNMKMFLTIFLFTWTMYRRAETTSRKEPTHSREQANKKFINYDEPNQQALHPNRT